MGANELYVRTASGDTYYTFAGEAWKQFLGEDGYRITIPLANGNELILRRDNEVTPEKNALGEYTFTANVTVRGLV